MTITVFQTKNNLNRSPKTLYAFIFLLFVTALQTTELRADHTTFYALPRIGSLIVSSQGVDSIQVAGLLVGMRVANALYIETEINTSVSGGEYFADNNAGQLTLSNFSLNGAYRQIWSKRFYAKLKTGVAYKTLFYDVVNNNSVDKKNDSFSASAGIGLGIIYYVANNPAMMEIEYTVIDKNFALFTIGTTIPF